MKITTRFAESRGQHSVYRIVLGVLTLLVLLGLLAAHHMEDEGHHVTSMTNHVVWGIPHVFAIFLILSASGALNLASLSSVFGVSVYKPLSRLSAIIAIALLIGGLAVLLLDLGRPDRLIVAITHFNFRSIFAWNVFLYSGFILISLTYLWLSMERRMHRWIKPAGRFALGWRLILTTGTGMIFGVLAARDAYDSYFLAPMFIIMSLAFGLAVFILILSASCKLEDRNIDNRLMQRLGRMLGWFVVAVIICIASFYLIKISSGTHQDYARFILFDGSYFSQLFWWIQSGGYLAAVLLLLVPALSRFSGSLYCACLLTILAALTQLYIIVIAGQAYPVDIFPGYQVQSFFMDGVVAGYRASLYEWALGLAGVSLALLIIIAGTRTLAVLPEILRYEDESQ